MSKTSFASQFPSWGVPGELCPNVKKHTKAPRGYVSFMEWAEKKGKTHDQLRCPECGLYVIWKPKVKSGIE